MSFPALHSGRIHTQDGAGSHRGKDSKPEEDKQVQEVIQEISRPARTRTGGGGGITTGGGLMTGTIGGSASPVVTVQSMTTFMRNLFSSCEYGQTQEGEMDDDEEISISDDSDNKQQRVQ